MIWYPTWVGLPCLVSLHAAPSVAGARKGLSQRTTPFRVAANIFAGRDDSAHIRDSPAHCALVGRHQGRPHSCPAPAQQHNQPQNSQPHPSEHTSACIYNSMSPSKQTADTASSCGIAPSRPEPLTAMGEISSHVQPSPQPSKVRATIVSFNFLLLECVTDRRTFRHSSPGTAVLSTFCRR